MSAAGRTSNSSTGGAAGGGRSGGASGTGATHSGGTGVAGGANQHTGGTGGSSAGAGGTGAAAVGASGSGAVTSATFSDVYAIISQNCGGASCHLSATGAAGLSMLDKMTAYTNLVGAASSKCRGQQRVVAGSPDTSVLVHALQHTTFSTCRPPGMPEAKPKLAQSSIDTVRGWISAGAPNN
jgi:hypothetical protein